LWLDTGLYRSCFFATERLDATLDDYEVEIRKPEQSGRTGEEFMFTSTPVSASLVQPVTADGIVNGSDAHCATTIVTHVEQHHAPESTQHEVRPITQQPTSVREHAFYGFFRFQKT